MTTLAPNRISEPSGPQAGAGAEVVDRALQLEFRFDGKRIAAHPGDTIASALTAAGEVVVSRSFKYHRPRGLLCCSGHCPNCLVQIGDEPNVRSCQRQVEHGLEVSSQNAWPSRKRDLLSLSQKISRFMPVGFYYKTFFRPQWLWPLFERFLRNVAGLGKVDEDSQPSPADKQYLHGDVVVVGGGPAGIAAAQAATETGCRVILFDENQSLGGHVRYRRGGVASHEDLCARVETLLADDRVDLHLDTAVVGLYEDNWLSAVHGNRLFKVRAGAIVVATGAHEVPLVFDNNDLPGVMLGSGIQRLLHLYGVTPGKRAVVVTANDDGWQVAADLMAAGVEVAAVADERASDSASAVADELAAQGVECLFGHTIRAAHGSARVRSAVLAAVGDGANGGRGEKVVNCDVIALSVAWSPILDLAYMAGGRGTYDEDRCEMRLEAAVAGTITAGRCAGLHSITAELADGVRAGFAAASQTGSAAGDDIPNAAATLSGYQRDPDSDQMVKRSSSLTVVSGRGKRFVCLCEDVTDIDIETAMAEGYDSIELLKRYSTVTMGPCQGRMCSLNSIRLCARNGRRTVQQVGKTTSRPPVTPVTLGALAGQKMEPVQVSPIHEWHLDRNARMLVAGLWLRPEHYGDPAAEVGAVRNSVGLIDVSPLGKFQLTGPAVPDLLERMYINDWRSLRRGRVRYGIMCDDEGIILDDGVCARVGEESWYMSTTSTGATSVGQWMEWWMQSGWGGDGGVHLVDLTETHAAFNLAGPRSRELLQKLTDRDLSNEKLPYMRIRSANITGVPCRVLRLGFTGELSYEIHCPAGFGLYLWEQLMAAGKEFGILPFGIEAQRVLRLEKAHIIVGQDTDALSDAIAANAEWAVKLDKADFLGKRALQRVSTEGTAQRLVGFRMVDVQFVPDEGLQIVQTDGRNRQSIIGWVTSSRFSPTLACSIGLCWLPTAVASQESASVYIHTEEGLREAHVHHGAFYDPQGLRVQM